MRGRWRWVCVVAVGVLLLAGCRVDTRVDISLHRDGTGVLTSTVTLDGDALNQLGGVNAATRQVPLSDLRAAGWNVSSWTPATDGGASISFSHAFHDAHDLAARLSDLVGPGGVLRDPHIVRNHGWFSSHDELSLVLDLHAPTTGIGSDADLQARLRVAGLDPATLDAQFSEQLRNALHVQVVVHLPNGKTHTYDGAMGSTATLRTSDQHTDYDRMVKLGIASVLALLCGMFLIAASVGRRRDRRRRAQRARVRRVEHERAPLM